MATAEADVPRLSIMTYNIRCDNPEDPYLWRDRSGEIVELLDDVQPDILGVQEALSHQVKDLAAALPDYAYVGVGRGPDVSTEPDAPYREDAGEFNAIFYRAERLEPLSSGTFWLSETPDTAGSRLGNSALPRIATWARFRDTASERVFLVLNTHFPYESGSEGEAARAFSAELILKRLLKLSEGQPVIFTGDLNFSVDEDDDVSLSYLPLTSVLADSFYANAPKLGPPYTFTGFEVTDDAGKRIDYIMVSRSPAVTVLLHEVIDEDKGDYYLSDHLPIRVVVMLP